MRPHPIRVGYTDSPGFIEKTAAGTVDGYGVAYLNEISHYTGWRYEYVYATWQECLELLAKGELDLLGMAQYTPERAASYEFASLPSGVEYMVMDRHPGKQGSTLLYLLYKGLVTHTGQVFEIGIYLVLADLSVQALAFSVQILKLCLLIP